MNHLLSHIWPLKRSGAWLRHIEQLVQRWDTFEGGVKCVAIASSPEAENPKHVREMLPEDCDSFVVTNDPKLREVASWVKLLSRVKDKPGFTFCCHAKGVTHDPIQMPQIQWWSDMMMHVCMDWPGLREKALARYPIVGCFKRPNCYFSQIKGLVPWHYSGTFFWVRNDDLFGGRHAWNQIDQHTHGTETWPSKHYGTEEAGCLFDQHPSELPYSRRYWDLMVKPSFQQWSDALLSIGQSMTATSLPSWLEKLLPSSHRPTGLAGTGTGRPVSGNSLALDLYHHYVLTFLRA